MTPTEKERELRAEKHNLDNVENRLNHLFEDLSRELLVRQALRARIAQLEAESREGEV